MTAKDKKTVVQLYFDPNDPAQARAAEILGGRTKKSAYVADAICFFESAEDKDFIAAATKFRAAILKGE